MMCCAAQGPTCTTMGESKLQYSLQMLHPKAQNRLNSPATDHLMKIESPPSCKVFTTAGKANQSGTSPPSRSAARNLVPDSFCTSKPRALASDSEVKPRALPSAPT